ncbi:hypothetical protein TWF225_007564 [Orbilia oligospora]|uniref:Uncharacterized protein n=2 Tax=Orbilia oligospora TaxID=2813651 RepID=A0A7C8P8Y3_ORBOL|nr:hypothetical protein TWF751_001081 [Orbilia oligospora]KAF3179355.1 hypothetical protein TWF225_007564 [Orbilia oligospora]KAF3240814.1 hypothetical protein TWF217_000695 [Orbilia oligospora]KAF3253176.1 hypothetical protein TWF128_006602 [Orbilia oligospora]KAF3253178.1 hypothetical protein TWF128_006602 [Orbilia oligospora]
MTSTSNSPETQNSIFHAAQKGNVDDIIYFVSKSQSPNSQGCGGYTPLHIACAFGHKDAVRTLLVHGGDPEQKTEDGKTARDVAEGKGFTEIVELIEGGEWKVERGEYAQYDADFRLLAQTCLLRF